MQRNPAQMYNFYMNNIHSLQQSVSHWKSRFDELSTEMLAGRDRYQPATDAQIQRDMDLLRASVKTLASTVTRLLGVSHEKFCEEVRGRMLSEVADEGVWQEKRGRNALLQSAIWKVLYQQQRI